VENADLTIIFKGYKRMMCKQTGKTLHLLNLFHHNGGMQRLQLTTDFYKTFRPFLAIWRNFQTRRICGNSSSINTV